MMKIALIGYGKMGKAIEQIAIAKGHEIVLAIGKNNLHEFTAENIQKADVAIEFSTPDSAFNNVVQCLQCNVPVICGTTAWLQHLPKVHQLVSQNNTAFISASNFSIGVNLFFAVNEYLAAMMAVQPQYQIELQEIHHTQKLDAPSGTAVTLAEGVLKHIQAKTSWVNHATDNAKELAIISKRIDPAPGTHSIAYTSEIDTIEITHTAHNRIGFATGAVTAAEFIIGKKGVFTMKDVLGL
jgi:4-hydroxy-tetrahydrodipicolinate reductase